MEKKDSSNSQEFLRAVGLRPKVGQNSGKSLV